MAPYLDGEVSASNEGHAVVPFSDHLNALSRMDGERSMTRSTPTGFVGMQPPLSLTHECTSHLTMFWLM
jgi:hypothetical protein